MEKNLKKQVNESFSQKTIFITLLESSGENQGNQKPKYQKICSLITKNLFQKIICSYDHFPKGYK